MGARYSKRRRRPRLTQAQIESLYRGSIFGNNIDTLMYILNYPHRVDPNMVIHGVCVLNLAIESGQLQITKILIKAGANIHVSNAPRHPLLQAAMYGRAELAELLINNGCNVNIRNERNETCLHLLCHQTLPRFVQTASVLLKHNLDPNVLDEDGFAALHKASAEIAVLLCKWPLTNINLCNREGDTALTSAVKTRKQSIVATLIENGGLIMPIQFHQEIEEAVDDDAETNNAAAVVTDGDVPDGITTNTNLHLTTGCTAGVSELELAVAREEEEHKHNSACSDKSGEGVDEDSEWHRYKIWTDNMRSSSYRLRSNVYYIVGRSFSHRSRHLIHSPPPPPPSQQQQHQSAASNVSRVCTERTNADSEQQQHHQQQQQVATTGPANRVKDRQVFFPIGISCLRRTSSSTAGSMSKSHGHGNASNRNENKRRSSNHRRTIVGGDADEIDQHETGGNKVKCGGRHNLQHQQQQQQHRQCSAPSSVSHDINILGGGKFRIHSHNEGNSHLNGTGVAVSSLSAHSNNNNNNSNNTCNHHHLGNFIPNSLSATTNNFFQLVKAVSNSYLKTRTLPNQTTECVGGGGSPSVAAACSSSAACGAAGGAACGSAGSADSASHPAANIGLTAFCTRNHRHQQSLANSAAGGVAGGVGGAAVKSSCTHHHAHFDQQISEAAAHHHQQYRRLDINKVDSAGVTPLMLCADLGSVALPIAKMLVDATPPDSCNLAARDRTQMTAAHHACVAGGSLEMTSYVVARTLERCGADAVNWRDKLGRTMIYVAASRGHTHIVNYLLTQPGVDLRLPNKELKSPLYIAAYFGHLAIVHALLRCHADIGQADSHNKTPLYVAAYHGRTDIVQLLLSQPDSRRRTVNVADKNGRSPLYIAVLHGHMQIARKLLEAGACVNQTDNDGQGPLHMAVKFPKLDIPMVKLLLQYGCDPLNLASFTGWLVQHNIIRFECIHGDDEFRAWLQREQFNVKSLKRLCRVQIQRTLANVNAAGSVAGSAGVTGAAGCIPAIAAAALSSTGGVTEFGDSGAADDAARGGAAGGVALSQTNGLANVHVAHVHTQHQLQQQQQQRATSDSFKTKKKADELPLPSHLQSYVAMRAL